jgi:trehalose 6-phosphate synthase
MARLVIVSNRLSLPSGNPSRAGGLAVAVHEAMRDKGGLWFGWSGETSLTPADKPRMITKGKITYAAVDLSPTEHALYYTGYANATLWPLLHYRLDLVEYRRDSMRAYYDVNRRFAAMLAPLIQPDDLIWVHDYHLIPLGSELRALGLRNRIGFFMHTPFPPADIVMALPRHTTLIEAMCAYDLVGLHTADHLRAFLGCITEIAGGTVRADGGFTAFGRRSRAAAFPIGIDTQGFVALAQGAAGSNEMQRLEESLSGRHLILGVDRLDYTKGIPQRFEAIETLLSDWPEHRRHFNYLQITPYSREEVRQYRALRRDMEKLAGHVNAKFAEFDWVPIRYINKSFTRATLSGFLRRARVGLVTPLRDGMNLVAKEYVAAQNPDDPGVLVLSCFAGAAKELDAALLVNPIDLDAIAASLQRALTMPLEERRERWRAMMDVVEGNTVATWCANFIAALMATTPIADEQADDDSRSPLDPLLTA